MQQIFHGSTLFGTNEENAEQRKEHANGCNKHWSNNSLELHLWYHCKSGSTKGSSRKNTSAIALIKVSSHTSHVAHVITHIVCNGSGVTWIVFGNISLNLTHDVGTYVGSFGIDTTTYTSKQGLRRSTHTESQHGSSDRNEAIRIKTIEHDKPNGNVEQAKTNHGESHYGTRTESYLQASIKTLTSSISCTTRRVCSSLHSKESCQSREETTRQEGKGYPWVLYAHTVSHESKEGSQGNKHI